MATLVIKSGDLEGRILQLKMGVNRFGRGPKNDFQIEHASVSLHHCEVLLRDGEVRIRDLDSTNGTSLEGKAIKESVLQAGQTMHLGDVELLVESTDVSIAIPVFDKPLPAPPVVLSDGSLICPRHKQARATHQCTHCREVLCDACVNRLQRKGGKGPQALPAVQPPLRSDRRREKEETVAAGFLAADSQAALPEGQESGRIGERSVLTSILIGRC